MDLFNVAVVGGGPAGVMAAIGAKQASPDLSVCIVDPCIARRHRIGEALLTGTIMTFAEAGIVDSIAAAGYHLKVGAAYVWGETREPWYVEYPPIQDGSYPACFTHASGRYAIHVPRDVFDPHLRREAERRGVVFIRDTVASVGVSDSASGPIVTGLMTSGGRKIAASRYVDATGHGALFSRRLTKRVPVGQARIARYAYTADVNWELAKRHGFDIHRTNIISNANGWFWVIHLGTVSGGLTSVGFVSTPDVIAKIDLDNCTDCFPELAWFGFGSGYLAPRTFDGHVADRLYAHPDYGFACEHLDGQNWSLAGDAAMFIDPILSQGVTLAVHYGYLRGKAAAAEIEGASPQQRYVTEHYRREGAILRQVVGEWYENNRSAGDWRMRSVMISRDEYGREMDEHLAFRWITNLENLRHDYDPYPPEERRKVRRRLGIAQIGPGNCD